MEKQTWLPIELVLNVIVCSLPTPDAILDAAHPTTKLLLAFTLVCQETKRAATRYLRHHCVYLDSERRLGSFLRAIPLQPALRKIPSLTLAPFQDDIDDRPLCSWVRELLCFTCETLTRLVIDIPLRTCYPEDDHLAVRPLLREGFERLVNLEQFVSTQDELYLDVVDREFAFVWKSWPKLNRLALWNVAADQQFWCRVAQHPSLEVLILSNPDCLLEVNPKAEYFKYTRRPLRVIICQPPDWRVERPDYVLDGNWEILDPGRKLTMYKYTFPKNRNDRVMRPHQDFVRSAAENGSLWNWEGKEIEDPEQISDLL